MNNNINNNTLHITSLIEKDKTMLNEIEIMKAERKKILDSLMKETDLKTSYTSNIKEVNTIYKDDFRDTQLNLNDKYNNIPKSNRNNLI
jgi:hypothetical protein